MGCAGGFSMDVPAGTRLCVLRKDAGLSGTNQTAINR